MGRYNFNFIKKLSCFLFILSSLIFSKFDSIYMPYFYKYNSNFLKSLYFNNIKDVSWTLIWDYVIIRNSEFKQKW